jgi:predicted regulator of Ras-like GTPase activity (Roadblock/LC7/MglB family)
MSSALAGLNQIPGVIGSVIFNAQDECVVHMMPAPFEPVLLGRVMAELRNALNVLSYLDDSSSWNAIVIRYDAGYLVVRQLHRLTVMVIAQPGLNPAMLSVGFNVAALKLEKEGLPPAPLPPPPMPPPRTTGAYATQMPVAQPQPAPHQQAYPLPAPPYAPPPSATQPIHQPHAAGSSSGNLSISQSGGIPGISAVSQSSPRLAWASTSGRSEGGQDSSPTVADAVGKTILDGLLRALARHIGPFAKLIMKEELTKLGLTASTLGFSQYDDFVSLLSRRVQDPTKRREFLTEAEALPHKR